MQNWCWQLVLYRLNFKGQSRPPGFNPRICGSHTHNLLSSSRLLISSSTAISDLATSRKHSMFLTIFTATCSSLLNTDRCTQTSRKRPKKVTALMPQKWILVNSLYMMIKLFLVPGCWLITLDAVTMDGNKKRSWIWESYHKDEKSGEATQQLDWRLNYAIKHAYLSLSIHSTTFPKAPAPSVNTTSSGKDR